MACIQLLLDHKRPHYIQSIIRNVEVHNLLTFTYEVHVCITSYQLPNCKLHIQCLRFTQRAMQLVRVCTFTLDMYASVILNEPCLLLNFKNLINKHDNDILTLKIIYRCSKSWLIVKFQKWLFLLFALSTYIYRDLHYNPLDKPCTVWLWEQCC